MKQTCSRTLGILALCVGGIINANDIDARVEVNATREAITQGDYGSALQHIRAVTAAAVTSLQRTPPSVIEKVPSINSGASAGTPTQLLVMIDQVSQALDGGDMIRVREYSVTLGTALYQEWARLRPAPNQKLAQLEQGVVNATLLKRFLALPDLSKASYAAGDMTKALIYANEVLSLAAAHASAWPQGEAIHHGNIIAGRVALQRGDIVAARNYLLAAGRTKGSPSLHTFGPNMALAAELLAKGEDDVVVQYLAECKQFWKMGDASLSKWTHLIQQGKTPDFGPNLLY